MARKTTPTPSTQNLLQIRRELRASQRQMASLLSISLRTYQRWETGAASPSALEWHGIVAVLDAARADRCQAQPDVTDTFSGVFDAVIRVLAFGHRKHADRLAESGYGDAREHLDAVGRHIMRWHCSGSLDDETGESHLAHATARCILAMHCEELARKAAHPLPSAPEEEVPG